MKWLSRKLIAAVIGGVGLVLTGQADQLPVLAMTYIGAQGAVDITQALKAKKEK